MSFSGIVLNGGRSSRMGIPKGEMDFLGRPLIERSIDALVEAGASEVIIVGGKPFVANAKGVRSVEDVYPDEGPLGGLITGLLNARMDQAVVLSNDLMSIDGSTIRRILDFGQLADLAIPMAGGVPQVLTALWKVSCLKVLESAFKSGSRSLKSVIRNLDVVEILELDDAKFVNANTQSDIIEYTATLEGTIE
jgi:molybdopterin-guanine dinucleotide biosynthesis protein A